jgi:phage-related protein
MPTWPAYFVVIIAVAFALQTAILVAVFFQMKKSHEQVMRIANDLHARIAPVISRVELLVGETQPRIVSMVNDASEVVHIARNQAQKVDRVLTETLDRVRIQLLHTDRILTGVLETVEDAGSTVKNTVMGPIQQATAVIRGIKTGIDVLRSFRRPRDGSSATSSSEPSDEGLFI